MSATTPTHSPSAHAAAAGSHEPSGVGSKQLNAMDCTMLAVDSAVRFDGAPGFNTQSVLWLDGRLDVDLLRGSLQRLSQQHPGVTALLQFRGWRSEPHWVFRSDAGCTLHEINLAADDRRTVLDCTSSLLSTPFELEHEPPIRFYLLHRVNAGDVLVVQYSHVMVDNPGIVGLLKSLDRLSREDEPSVEKPIDNRRVLAEYLASHSRCRRLRAVWNTVHLRLASLRENIALFGGKPNGGERPLPLHVTTRVMEPEEVAELSSRVTAACRFPGLSMALLASVFRTGRKLGLATPADGRLTTGIGLELGLRTGEEPLLENLSSVVPLVAEPADCESQQQLTRLLNEQLRDRLQQGIDLGVITLSSALRRRRRFVRMAMRRLMCRGYSAWYASFGSSDGIGETYLGVPIQDFCYFGPSWPAVGLTVIANQFRGRLQLHATYVPACISDERAEAFMDALLEDLRDWLR